MDMDRMVCGELRRLGLRVGRTGVLTHNILVPEYIDMCEFPKIGGPNIVP